MPNWQITMATSALLFIAGALIIITCEQKESLLEGYAAWLMSLVILALEFVAAPKAFAPILAFFASIPHALTDPPIAVAAVCWLILMVHVIMALADKSARLFATTEQLGEIRLGPPDQPVKRSRLRRLADALRFSSTPKTETIAKPKLEAGPTNNGGSAWLAMLKSERIRDALSISDEEVRILTRVEFMGQVSSPHDLKLVLEVLRLAREKMVREAAADAQRKNASVPKKSESPAVKAAG
jgi:hypothetical protein